MGWTTCARDGCRVSRRWCREAEACTRARQRAGLQTVLLPARNLKDLRELPESARAAMQFIALDTVDDAIRGALAEPGTRRVPPDFKLV